MRKGKRGNWVTKNEKGDNEFISLKFVLALWGESKAFKNGAKLCIVMECCHSGGLGKKGERALQEGSLAQKYSSRWQFKRVVLLMREADGLPNIGGLLTYIYGVKCKTRPLFKLVKEFLKNMIQLDKQGSSSFVSRCWRKLSWKRGWEASDAARSCDIAALRTYV